MACDPGWIEVAVIGAAHGVSGEVRLKALTGDPIKFARYGPLFIRGRSTPLEIASVTPLKDDLFLVRFAGIADRDAAAGLRGLTLCVRREQLPMLGDNEYYHSDLVGLVVVTEAGETIGVVVAIDNFGAGDILEIRPSHSGESALIPFSRATVPTIDLAAKRITVSAEILGGGRKWAP